MAGEGDAERLVVLLEARTNDALKAMDRAEKKFDSSYGGMRRGSRTATQQMEADMVRSTNRINQAIASTSTKIGAFGKSFATGLLAGVSVKVLADLSSQWTDLQSRVDNATGSMQQGGAVMDRLTSIARRTYSALGQTVESFADNAQAMKELGYSTTQQLDLTEALNNSLVISATRGQQAESVMRAWTKAMAEGKLSGDNLNTIIQSGGRLAKALADSMGVGVNELRKLGSQGKITARDMFGVTRELETLRQEADAMPATITDSFTLLGNAVLQFAGQVDSATGVSSILAAEITQLADDIEQAARRWRDGEVPILQFAEAVVGLGRQLGLVQDEIEDTRTDIERMDDTIEDAQNAVLAFADEIASLDNVRDFAPHLPAEIQTIISEMVSGERTAEETRAALIALGTANPDFSLIIGRLAGLVANMRNVTTAAEEMYAAATQSSGPAMPRGAVGASRRARLEREGVGSGYVAEQERLLGLTREQLQVEQAIARIKKEVADAGGSITSAEAERLARLQVGAQNQRGGGRQSAKDENDAVKDLIASLEFEKSLLGKSALEQERMRAVRQAGASATGDQVKAIERLVTETYNEQARIEDLQGAYELLGQLGMSAVNGIIDALADGKIEAEEFGTIFADLLRMAGQFFLNQAFGGFGAMFGFSEGGYTGPGGKHQPAGVVHKGEVVWSQRDIARAGGVGVVEAMRRGVAGYVDGGLVAAPNCEMGGEIIVEEKK